MVFNATFNNISVILWRSVLLVEETEVPEENYWTPLQKNKSNLPIFSSIWRNDVSGGKDTTSDLETSLSAVKIYNEFNYTMKPV